MWGAWGQAVVAAASRRWELIWRSWCPGNSTVKPFCFNALDGAFCSGSPAPPPHPVATLTSRIADLSLFAAYDPDVFDAYSCASVSPGWVAAILYTTALVVVACLLFIYHQVSITETMSSAGSEETPISTGHDWNISCLGVRPARPHARLTLLRGSSRSTPQTRRTACGVAASHHDVRARNAVHSARASPCGRYARL